MTFEEVKAWLKENAEDEAVIAYLVGVSKSWIVGDDGKKFLESKEGKELYQAEIDRRVTGGIDTFKEKSMPDLIKEQTDKLMEKLNPKETPEQKRIRDLEEKQEISDKALKKEKLEKIVLQTLTHKKLTAFEKLAANLLGDDEEGTLRILELLADSAEVVIKEALKEALPGREVDTHEDLEPGAKNPWKKGDDYNLTEQGKIFRDDPEKAKRLMKAAG